MSQDFEKLQHFLGGHFIRKQPEKRRSTYRNYCQYESDGMYGVAIYGYPMSGLDIIRKAHGHEATYCNDPKISDRYAWANRADPDQTAQSDQCLHCLPFRLHRLDSLLYGRAT